MSDKKRVNFGFNLYTEGCWPTSSFYVVGKIPWGKLNPYYRIDNSNRYINMTN